MNKLFLIIASIILLFNTTNAQDEFRKKETFDNNTFGWDEIVEKKKSAIIQDGFLSLQVKKEKDPIVIATRFPMDVEHNFKITATFLVPKLTDDMWFGLVYNWIDEENYSVFSLQEDRYLVTKSDVIDSKGKIKLKSGKNQTVTVMMERKGGKIIFNVNNVKVCEVMQKLRSSYFGFYLTAEDGKSQINVDEVFIDQIIDEDD
jgi:hypothetical protein